MLTRRLFLATPLLLAARSDAAPKPAWWLGHMGEGRGRPITVRRSGGRTARGKILTQVTPRSIDITSTKNDNSAFHMWVVFPKQKDIDVFVNADGIWLVSDSYGHDNTGTQASFVLDRATAQRMAKALGVPLNQRAKLDAGLEATWSFPTKASALNKDPVTVKLVVKNAGKTTVGFVIGGRQRGPRDNRFSFSVSRNGTPVKLIEAHDFGGISYYKALKPGESTDLSVDLRSWADLSLPGHYQIDARYEGELAKDGKMPQTAAERRYLWDLTLVGQGGILVQ
jgi:hypothetical protein